MIQHLLLDLCTISNLFRAFFSELLSVWAFANNAPLRELSGLEQAEVDAIQTEGWSELMQIRRQMDNMSPPRE